MIEIIIFYLLFRTTLIIGFILGYLVRGLLHIQLINKLKKEAKEQQEDTAYILAREEEQLYTESLLKASDEFRKVYLN